MVANSTFLWPYNWPLDWPFWCNLLTEGVVSYEELGNAKKALSKKCASSVHPKNATDVYVKHGCRSSPSTYSNTHKNMATPLLLSVDIALCPRCEHVIWAAIY